MLIFYMSFSHFHCFCSFTLSKKIHNSYISCNSKESFGVHIAQLPSNSDFPTLITQVASETWVLAFWTDSDENMLFLLPFASACWLLSFLFCQHFPVVKRSLVIAELVTWCRWWYELCTLSLQHLFFFSASFGWPSSNKDLPCVSLTNRWWIEVSADVSTY